MSSDSTKVYEVWLTFISKIITPVMVLFLILLFKDTIEERLKQTSEVSVLGTNFKFESGNRRIDLSALEVYYMIHAYKMSSSLFMKETLADDELAVIYLLKSKELLLLEEQTGMEQVEGTLIALSLTQSGQELVAQLGLL